MKAEELMIGDWMQTLQGPRKVTIIGSEKIAISHCGFSHFIPIDEITPIPLTSEILEKNGFVYSDLPFEQSWQQFGLSLYRGGNGYRINCGQNVAMQIDSVHDLQHALKLCGIEKEIIL